MHHKGRFPNVLFGGNLRANSAALAIMVLLLFLIFIFLFLTLTAQPAQAQSFTVIHSFTNGADGADPLAGLAMDAAGNLYGTTVAAGEFGLCAAPPGCGTIFKLTLHDSNWVTAPIYKFHGRSDGGHPESAVLIAADGSLYGTTYPEYATLYRLTPAPNPPVLSPWNITTLYFLGGVGALGELVFDAHGNVYGTIASGGAYSLGAIYQWTGSSFNLLYSPQHSSDPWAPEEGITFDQSGNLYGTFSDGGPYQSGAIYELSPSQQGWQEQILYNFPEGGYAPVSGLIIDSQGNLYGRKAGRIFELTHYIGYWDITWIYDTGSGGIDRLVMDSAGSLYGTAAANGAYGMGSVFKLTPSHGGWTYTSLHDFCPSSPSCTDGAQPLSNVVFDANGNLYGTASAGGAYGYGVVWEITP